jgi:hypothetical protein
LSQKTETEKEKQQESEEAPETTEKEAPQRELPIPRQTAFDEEGLGPFLDIYMQTRGLTNRKAAATLLGKVIKDIGYDPKRDIENVDLYLKNLAAIVNTIPDSPETDPVKGALVSRGMTDAAGMLSVAHFGGRGGEMDDVKEIMRYGMKIKAAFSALDQAYGGMNTQQESETVKDLKSRLDRMEKKNEFEASLAPIKQQMANLTDQIKELTKKPTTPDESAALKEVRESINKINARFEKREEQDRFTTEMQGIRADLKSYQENLGKGGGAPGDVSGVFDQAITLMDKITDLQKKYGAGGEEGLDWRAATISTVGEIGTEAIRAAREIYSKREIEEETETGTQKEPVSQRIIDRRVLNYIREHAASGATEINTLDAAKALKLSQKQVFDSYQRLAAKGLATTPGAKTPEHENTETTKKTASKWVEGA